MSNKFEISDIVRSSICTQVLDVIDTLFFILVRRQRLLLYIFGVYGLLLGVRRILNAPNHNASQRE